MTALVIVCCCIGLGVGCLLSRLGWSEPPRSERSEAYPRAASTPFRRVRQSLGWCFWCGHRSRLRLVFENLNDAGNVTSETPYRVCLDHAKKAIEALTSVPHEGTATFTDGAELSWSTEGEDA